MREFAYICRVATILGVVMVCCLLPRTSAFAAPEISITSPVDSQTYDPTSWAPSFTCIDSGSTCATGPDSCQYSYLDPDLQSSVNIDCFNGGTDITAPTADGSYTLYVRAIDGSGDWGTPSSVNFTYNAPPEISIISPSPGNSYGSNMWSPSVTWENTGGETCEYSYDNSSWTPVSCGAGGTDIPPPGQGSYYLYIRETDTSSYSSTADTGGSFNFDGTAPSVAFMSPVQGQSYNSSTWLPAFTCDDGVGLGCASGAGSCEYGFVDPALPNSFDHPSDVTTDGTHLYIVDNYNHRIVKRLASDLTFVASVGGYGSGNNEFLNPEAITNDGTYLYVADFGNHRIVKRLASDLSFVASVGSYGSGNNQFLAPSGITSDGAYLYVADSNNHRIVKRLASDLSFVASIGSYGLGNDQFNYPVRITSDGTYLYVADGGNNRIVKRLASDLSFVASVGSTGSGNDEFNSPRGITCDGTYLYVADAANRRIVKRLATNLSFVAKVGSTGSGNDQFRNPYGIASDGTHIYVADIFNHRIIKRRASDLSFEGTIGSHINAGYVRFSIDCDNQGTDILPPPAGGSYTLYVRAQDVAGNWGNATAVNFTYTGLPAISISSPSAGSFYGPNNWSPSVSWETNGGETCEYSYNGSTWSSVNCSNGGSDITAPGNGIEVLYVRQTDAALNQGRANTFGYFHYDSTPPTATPTSTSTATATSTPTATPTSTATATTTPTSTATSAPTATHTVTPTPLPTKAPTIVPPPPPSMVIGVPPESTGNNQFVVSKKRVVLSGTGTLGHTIEIQVDGIVVGTALVNANSALGVRITNGVWQFKLPPLATGTREIVTVSIDESGNRSAPSAAMKLVVLDVAPLDFAGSGDSAIAAFRRVKDTIRFKMRSASESRWSNAEIPGRYPAPADYDNDGITDLAAVGVVRGKLQWNINLSSTGSMSTAALGDLGDTIISGCHFESEQGASLSTFRSDRRELVFRSYNGSTERIVKLSKLSRGDLLGCGDTDGDGKDEILFRVRGGKKGASSVAAFDTAGNRKVFAGYNKFLRGFVVRRTGTQVPLVAVLRGTTNNGRQVKITTMAGSFAFPMFYISRSATIGTGIFTNQTNDQIPGLFWADNRSGVVSRRLLTKDAQTTTLFNLPDGYTLIRSQNVIRTGGPS